jgi:hypothetical protein
MTTIIAPVLRLLRRDGGRHRDVAEDVDQIDSADGSFSSFSV